jgi:hypothetical protein
MKRLSSSARVRLTRLARKRAIRRARGTAKAQTIRRLVPMTRVRWQNKYGHGRTTARKRIPLPENFCLEQNYEDTAVILAEIWDVLSVALKRHYGGAKFTKRPSKLQSFFDFVPVRRISPAAALIVASEYDRSRTLVDWSIPIINHDRWSPDVTDTLEEIGFFELLDISVPVDPDRPRAGSSVVRFMAIQSVETMPSSWPRRWRTWFSRACRMTRTPLLASDQAFGQTGRLNASASLWTAASASPD